MSTSINLTAQRAPWKALLAGSALFLMFTVIALSSYGHSNFGFSWAVDCKFGGHCGYAVTGFGPIPVTEPPVNWLTWQFMLLNPGLWFGAAFSILYDKNWISRGFPPIALGLMGAVALLVTKIFHVPWGPESAGVLLISAPFSFIGSLIGYAYHQTQRE